MEPNNLQTRKSFNKRTGDIGELIASKHYASKGFSIIARNYSKKYGEIDVVARGTTGKYHFIEVKTVSYETRYDLEHTVTQETWRPEEKVDAWKLHKISLAVEAWLREHPGSYLWQIDIAAVKIVPRERIARIKIIENVIIEQ